MQIYATRNVQIANLPIGPKTGQDLHLNIKSLGTHTLYEVQSTTQCRKLSIIIILIIVIMANQLPPKWAKVENIKEARDSRTTGTHKFSIKRGFQGAPHSLLN